MHRHVEVSVCQGVGDVFWCYQLLSPHVDSIRFEVLQVGIADGVRQGRAAPWLRLLPKVAGVSARVTAHREYYQLAHSRFDLAPLLRDGKGSFACNLPLEQGERLESLGVGGLCEETVPIRVDLAARNTLPEHYACAYVSGDTLKTRVREDMGLWKISQWANLLRGLRTRNLLPEALVVLGASYDREAALALAGEMRAFAKTTLLIDAPPAQVAGVIAQCELFVGYQSGLSVIADQFDRRQIMVYFRHLRSMRHAWPKQRNLSSGLHYPVTCDQTEQQVLAGLPPGWN